MKDLGFNDGDSEVDKSGLTELVAGWFFGAV